jgi:hypothetical protein
MNRGFMDRKRKRIYGGPGKVGAALQKRGDPSPAMPAKTTEMTNLHNMHASGQLRNDVRGRLSFFEQVADLHPGVVRHFGLTRHLRVA